MLRHGKMSNGAEKLSKVSFILMTPPVRDPHPLRSRLDFSSSTTFSSPSAIACHPAFFPSSSASRESSARLCFFFSAYSTALASSTVTATAAQLTAPLTTKPIQKCYHSLMKLAQKSAKPSPLFFSSDP